MPQTEIISGPPKYFTCDWQKAELSVQHLANLRPLTVATGHGKPMKGDKMLVELTGLADNFRRKAVPKYGRYVHNPAITNTEGVVSVPQKPAASYFALITIGVVLSTVAFSWALLIAGKKRAHNDN